MHVIFKLHQGRNSLNMFTLKHSIDHETSSRWFFFAFLGNLYEYLEFICVIFFLHLQTKKKLIYFFSHSTFYFIF
jgi:hypothetical protein